MSQNFAKLVLKQIVTTLQGSVRCQTRNLATVLAGSREKRIKYGQSDGLLQDRRYLHTTNTHLAKSDKKFSTAISDKKFSTAIELQDTANEVSIVDKSLATMVNEKIKSDDLGRLFAVVQICSKQRKITAEDIIVVEGDFHPTVGDRIRLEKVLMVGGKDFTLVGRPIISRQIVCVEATVVEKTMSQFRVRFKYIKTKRNQKFKLFRDPQTMLVINSIELNQVD